MRKNVLLEFHMANKIGLLIRTVVAIAMAAILTPLLLMVGITIAVAVFFITIVIMILDPPRDKITS